MSRILIAEDESRIAMFVEKGLLAAGYSASVVATGPAALDAGRSGDFDLVLLDVGLPGMDGFEVLRRLRGGGVRTPVVMLTARTGTDDTV